MFKCYLLKDKYSELKTQPPKALLTKVTLELKKYHLIKISSLPGHPTWNNLEIHALYHCKTKTSLPHIYSTEQPHYLASLEHSSWKVSCHTWYLGCSTSSFNMLPVRNLTTIFIRWASTSCQIVCADRLLRLILTNQLTYSYMVWEHPDKLTYGDNFWREQN